MNVISSAYSTISDSSYRSIELLSNKGTNVICNSTDTLVLSAPLSNYNSTSYFWYYEGVNINIDSIDLEITIPGEYSVSIIDTSLNCSFNTDIVNVSSSNFPSEVPLMYNGNLNGCIGDPLFLLSNSFPSLEYEWYKNGSLVYESYDSIYSITSSGLYNL